MSRAHVALLGKGLPPYASNDAVLVKSSTSQSALPFAADSKPNMKRTLPGRLWATVGLLFVLLWAAPRVTSYTRPNAPRVAAPVLDITNGLTGQVQWDNYSLSLNGQRIFLHSGEFHTFRLPVPSLWLDILQKIKAAGLNAISLYTHWGLINPSPGVIDLDGYRALEPLYEAAKAAGIFVVLRPGPYINAETTAGGIAHWVTSQVAGGLRTNATDYEASWKDYVSGIINATVPYQITNGGPVIAIQIDNEYTQNAITGAYFEGLEAAYHNSSIVVPLTYNDPGEGKNFVNGTGAPDIYGLDSYPQGFDCSNPTVWKGVTTNYHSYHEETNPQQPFYIPEFQGGSFDAWGPAPGYLLCRQLTGPDFQSVFNLQLWASNVKLVSYYMVYGGTSWGALPFPGVYTSYDYGSPIAESRELTTKHAELKRQGLFLRSSPEFYKTDWVGDSTTGTINVTNSNAFVTYLRNPDTSAGFYIARQNDSTATDTLNFKLTVSTSAGELQLPQTASAITLGGRQSKVIVTDYAFGSSRALYSTAQVLFAGKIGDRDVLYLFGDSSQEHEASITFTGTPNQLLTNTSDVITVQTSADNSTLINVLPGTTGLVTIYDSDTQLVLFSDTDTAATFWSPVLPGNSSSLDNYWQFGSNSSVLVGGPYLVRNASIIGSELALRGDLNDSVRISIIAPPTVTSITWNGQSIGVDASASFNLTTTGGFVGQLQPAATIQAIAAPVLSDWKFADSLPEIQDGFDDGNWTLANHTTTNIPFKPYYGDGRVLYGCDYEFCENIVLWRGHFNATGIEKSVNLSINGGEAFAASVWVNDVFLNTSFGNSTNNLNILEETDEKFFFPNGSLKVGQDNVITVVQDNMGLDETEDLGPDASKSPRGIRGFQLDSGNFSDWKVQGKIGGYSNYPDKTRGVFNEGGLFGERKGWHLPGFDTSGWESRNLSEGLPNSTAGVGFFVSTFDLAIPHGNDVFLSFNFNNASQPYRAYLFVNGWMMGKRVGNLGPQTKFPVHEGILEYQGTNTVAVALWALEPNTPVSPTLDITIDAAFEGGVGGVVSNNPPWSADGRDI